MLCVCMCGISERATEKKEGSRKTNKQRKKRIKMEGGQKWARNKRKRTNMKRE